MRKKTVKPEVQADEQDAARETIIYSKTKRGISKEDSNDDQNKEVERLKQQLELVSHIVYYFLQQQN
jgi:hypothetical protein